MRVVHFNYTIPRSLSITVMIPGRSGPPLLLCTGIRLKGSQPRIADEKTLIREVAIFLIARWSRAPAAGT